ncbi:WXG100 family type VII secretion target [Bacillus thuringiensis]|uniref:WXG100 family type VII secretion target n=1 Tax=Bacillus thuringiensis TaxID=1428 RepID=UPI000BF5E6FC|nr:WXG100 family type VII secretion target [Bacillus thuringiensis]PFL06537.1 type VII secretion protein [Bacillus thuringiensis]PGU47410.1 type VII secretion protein [Bacillus thuringiensis]
MVQIKITPEELEQVAKRANDTKHALESIHNNLCNQIDYMCFQWTGASNQNFVQMFNNARPSAFTAINALVHVEEELKRIAEKFRVADNEGVTTQKETTPSKSSEKSFLGKVWDGIVDGAGDAVGDTIDGIKALGDWETWKDMGYTVTHLDEALPAMWDALSDSFNKDVINGDAETRARWGSYALTQIGLGLLGDKGVSKAAKLAQGAKFSQGISKAGQLFNKGDNLAFAGGNGSRSVFDSATFKQTEEKLSTYQFAKGEGNIGTTPKAVKVTPSFNRENLSEHIGEGFASQIDNVLKEANISNEQFHNLKVKHYTELNAEEIQIMKKIRDSVPAPTQDTLLQKVISLDSVDNYLKETEYFNSIGGCVAKMEDVKPIHSPKDVYESLRLDYEGTPYTTTSDYAVIRFKTDDVEKMKIPYAQSFEDSTNMKPNEYIHFPQTGNGFTAAENGRIVPEYETSWGDFMKPQSGAEIYSVINQEEKLVAVYHDRKQRFIPATEKQ